MRVLIVHAHHEPKSFNAAMTDTAVRTLRAAGHEVVVSDLYAQGFDPVSDRRNFTTVADAAVLKQQAEEALASAEGGFAPELAAEIEKLDWCDVLILQFPIWWLGPPAILKGWIDRVFAVGVAYGGGRWFDRGRLKGKRAMCAVTVGGGADVYSDRGVYGAIKNILYPLHRGVFAFTGLEVVEPFVVYAPNRIDAAERAAWLARYEHRLLDLDGAPKIPGPDMAEFDGLVRRR
ncbi:NAD(P)H-dependent oxidoreductase [Phenylobacterium sp.]|uniref:NAD(P)H-dependent oxidoreductase n=1 Tax=Phenylobacterium sp. TaxID=1871053 RepID=UPI0035B2D545